MQLGLALFWDLGRVSWVQFLWSSSIFSSWYMTLVAFPSANSCLLLLIDGFPLRSVTVRVQMDKATVLAETIKLVKKLRRRVGQLEKGNPDNSGTPNLSLVTSEDSQIGTTSPSSRGEPGSPIPARTGAGSSEPELQEGKPPGGRFLDSCLVPAPAPSQEDNKEIVEVDRRACIPTELRAKIRTSHRPDTVIHILTCLKDLGLEVLSTNISIEKDWVYADFQLKVRFQFLPW